MRQRVWRKAGARTGEKLNFRPCLMNSKRPLSEAREAKQYGLTGKTSKLFNTEILTGEKKGADTDEWIQKPFTGRAGRALPAHRKPGCQLGGQGILEGGR